MSTSSLAGAYVGIIPARGGSKTLRRKNVALLAGRPLLAYTCQAARESKLLSVIVSTDDSEIAAVAEAEGVSVPFMRPADLGQDDTPMIDVLTHALAWFREHEDEPRALVLLQPTSPLRRAEHIDAAIALFEQEHADSVVSIVEVPHQYNPVSVLKIEGKRVQPFLEDVPLFTRREDKPAAYARNGPAVLVVAPECIDRGVLYGERTLGYVMDRRCSLDIDDQHDLELAEALIVMRPDPAS